MREQLISRNDDTILIIRPKQTVNRYFAISQVQFFIFFYFMDFSNLFRHFCHSHWFDFPTYPLHTSTFLPPFAPHPLRCLFAPMEALTPDKVTPSLRYP